MKRKWEKVKKGRHESDGFAIVEQPGGGCVLSKNARVVDFFGDLKDAKKFVTDLLKKEKKDAVVVEPTPEGD